MLDQDTITQQLQLLAAHRRTLAHLIEQAAQYGGEVFAPPQTDAGIEERRTEIARIKMALREGGVQVEDEPNDDARPEVEPAQRAVGDVVGGDKVMGDKRTINTQGGDYAEGSIDKRQGAFVESSTVIGDIIGQQNIINQPSLPPTLHQLRAPVGDFVGRADEINRLVSALSKGGTAVAISGVRGMGGIGKSELAFVVANRLKDVYSDAQLVVELRGASSNPMTAETALQQVIRSFEPEARLPDDVSQLQARYRSVLSGKRVLVLADDAHDLIQIRPLLPPPGCALLVTSRNRFSLPSMQTVDLVVLSPADAERLLLEVCPRIGDRAGELAKLCGYLPLALRVSASLLANSSRSVARYLEQLEVERLKHLSDPDTPDDPHASAEVSLRLSYAGLEPDAQQVLCQLSLFATSFDQAAALAVVEVAGDAEALLDVLQRRSLLEWDAALERYSLHELVRVFAAARLEDADAMWVRYARHYVEVADSADTLYLQGGAATLNGLALFDRERVHINTGRAWAQARAGEPDVDTLILDYADATVSIGDLRYDTPRQRIPQLEATLAAAQRLKRRGTEGATLGKLGNAYADVGDARKAIHFYEQVLTVTREIGDRRREANALGSLGRAYADLRDARKAIDFYEQALTIARELGDRRGEGLDLCNLGNAYTALGDARKAIDLYEQALTVARELGDRSGEALASWNLGIALERQGDLVRAAALIRVDVDYLSAIGHPDAEKHTAWLEQLQQRLASGGGGTVASEEGALAKNDADARGDK